MQRLVLLGVLGIEHESEWEGPSLVQPKPKTNLVRFLSEFRNLNNQLKRKSYPMLKINEMVFKLEGF